MTKHKNILGTSAIFGFQLYYSDDIQAYFPGSEKLITNVYLNLPKEMNLKMDHLIQLFKPLYGLPGSGDN